MKIKGIAFDIDGTLYHNRQMYILSTTSFVANPKLAYHFSKARKTIRTYEKIENFRKTQAGIIAQTMKKDPEQIYKLVEIRLYKKWVRAFRFLRPYRGVRKLVVDLKARGYKLGVLSDFPPQKKLTYLNLEGFWDAAFSSEEVEYLKPRPEPFLELAKRMELKPEEILYVGNSYKYDIIGASSVGMKTAYLSKKESVPPADIVFSSYEQLAEKLSVFLDD
ncbi:MAG: HAD family hydrolase [Spirochaetales bacterium]|nr:HAD family hydrolase [Spirochaetales bacterium]